MKVRIGLRRWHVGPAGFWGVIFLAGCTLYDVEHINELLDPDEDGVLWPDDCDNSDASVDDRSFRWYRDADGDGWGQEQDFIDQDCLAPEGYVSEKEAWDCDDQDPDVNPGMTELAACDENGENCCDYVDNDCNGFQDDGLQCVVSGIHPASDADLKLRGSMEERAGWAVAGVGDTNNRGYKDIVIGAPMGLDGDIATGAVYVVDGTDIKTYLGMERGLEASLDELASAVIYGSGEGAFAGYSLLDLSSLDRERLDYNSDEIADLVYGTPFSGDDGQAGAVHLHIGKDILDDEANLELSGESNGDRMGYSLQGGDFDGQGDDDDLVVGCPNGGEQSAGCVYVYEDLSVLDAANCDPVVLVGQNGGDQTGISLSNTGDVTGDGVPYFLIGANTMIVGGEGPGGAYLVSVVDELESNQEDTLQLSETGSIFLGQNDGDSAGTTVCMAGDTNGDGLDDFLVGAPDWRSGNRTGMVCLVGGEMNPPTSVTIDEDLCLAMFEGSQSDEAAGSSLGALGDLDGDGKADFLIGAEGGGVGSSGACADDDCEQGTISLFFGSIQGVYEMSDAPLIIKGEHRGDRFGHSQAILGELVGGEDAPHSSYVLIGAPDATGGAGAAYLFGLGGY